MIGILTAVGGVAVAWIAAPFVDMAVRGTVEQRDVAGWRSVGRPPAAAPVVAIPAPRTESASRSPRTIPA